MQMVIKMGFTSSRAHREEPLPYSRPYRTGSRDRVPDIAVPCNTPGFLEVGGGLAPNFVGMPYLDDQ